ncbi:hypothetical protein [Chromatocurvus halotolerans]|uniref:Mll5186 protein n=1 Tax=Chromatocurvus halotolerans TaxID=1132028 RepID=A0A4V2SBK4_9GAMM|nr:hypothetical protein [Chromatocurvus halotolerans]TCO75870.1 hypothetical protein EV688_10660 [Chromatocurvus halotolerans]
MTIEHPSQAVTVNESDRAYSDWQAIFTGAFFAAAFSLVLLTFGSGVGLTMMSAEPGEGISLKWSMIAAGVWFIVVAVSSFGAGAYLTGRMRHPIGDASEDEIETRDGVNGLTVWATGTLIAVVLAMGGIGSLMGITASATGAVAGGAAKFVEEQGDYFASLIVRNGTGASSSSESLSEIRTILARSVAEGEISESDRNRLKQIAAAEANMEPAEVEQRVNEALSMFKEAREEAMDAVDQARIAAVITTFVVAATMIAGAAVAYFAATLGGKHRDHGMPFSRVAFRREV